MARQKINKLNDSINVPVPRALKRRVISIAERPEMRLAHTAYTRRLIEDGVARDEKRLGVTAELVVAK